MTGGGDRQCDQRIEKKNTQYWIKAALKSSHLKPKIYINNFKRFKLKRWLNKP
jgi:hypothetical protein